MTKFGSGLRHASCGLWFVIVFLGCGARSDLDDRTPSELDATVDTSVVDTDTSSADTGARDASSPDTMSEPLSDIGDPCMLGDCRAGEVVGLPACIGVPPWSNGVGWVDGYCTAECTPSTSPGEGDELEQDDCPVGSLCVPYEESGLCFVPCELDADCRDEYICRRDFGGEAESVLDVGVCMGWHCRSRGCPGSAVCDC